MADHQPSRATVASSNVRNSRFNEFARPPGAPPIDETITQTGPQSALANPQASWIWSAAPVVSGPIGSGFSGSSSGSSSERRAPNHDDYLQPSGSGAFEGKQGSSSLLPGSGEHDVWPSNKTSAVGWNGDATSPGVSISTVSQDLSRSPVRTRNSTGKYESPQQSTEIPRSASPYYQVSRPNPVGQPSSSLNQSPNNKTYLDSAAPFGDKLEFSANNRVRNVDIGQFGSGRFVGVAGPSDGRHLGIISSSLEGEDSGLLQQQQQRGRGLSGTRGIVAENLLGPAVGRSESLPPQQRANSTPPMHPETSSANGATNYSSYTHLPSSQPVASAQNHLSQTVPMYNSNFQRYSELNRDPREEMLSQFGAMTVEEDGEIPYQARQRSSYHQQLQQAPAVPYAPFAEYPYRGHGGHGGSHGSSPWAQEDYRTQDAVEQYGPDSGGYPEAHNDRLRRYERSGTMSPGEPTQDHSNRRGLGSPYFPGTPPSGLENLRSPSRGGSQHRIPQGQIGGFQPEKLRQQLLVTQQQQNASVFFRDQLYRQQLNLGSGYPYEGYSAVRGGLPVGSLSGAMSPLSQTHPGPRRHEDFASLRSVLLEEFRSNSKSNKRYELKDIYDHVVEFSGDQHGSRFIQQKLETANSDEKETVFAEIRPNSLQLMTDVFGNYVIQKFFEHGNQLQKSILAKQMEGHVLTLSLQMYGCRVVQKALEHILTEQQATLVKELDGHVLKCVKDQNGNHVVQKAIERVPAEHIQFIIDAFHGQVQSLATHPYGCRVIQRMLEYCDEAAQASILKELHVYTFALVQDQYGNYVTQHVIEHGRPEDRAKIIDLVTSQLVQFSKHKFASNVVEKSIAFGTPGQKKEIVRVVTATRTDGTSPLQLLMRDQYGNYVIQKLLTLLTGVDRETLVDQIKPQLQALKKFTYGKQINAIEKLIFSSSTAPSQATSPPSSALATPPLAGTEPQSIHSSPHSTTKMNAKAEA